MYGLAGLTVAAFNVTRVGGWVGEDGGWVAVDRRRVSGWRGEDCCRCALCWLKADKELQKVMVKKMVLKVNSI